MRNMCKIAHFKEPHLRDNNVPQKAPFAFILLRRTVAVEMTWAFVAGSVSAFMHCLFFLLESVFFTNPKVSRGIFGIRSQEAVDAATIWALNQGFYNLFLAISSGFALYLLQTETGVHYEIGRALLGINNLIMVAAGAVLFFSSQGKLWLGAVIQGSPALAALISLYYGI